MSRDAYGGGGGSSSGPVASSTGRSPRPIRRDLNTDPYYPEGPISHSPGPIGRRSRSATRALSPTMALDPHSSYIDSHSSVDPDRRSGSAPASHHRSRSQSRVNPASRNYHSMDKDPHDREFMPIRDPRDRSMERGLLGPPGGPMDMHGGGTFSRRDRSLDRGPIMEDDLYRDHHGMGGGRTRISPSHGAFGGPSMGHGGFGGPGMNRDPYLMEMQMHNTDMQRELANLKKELELTNQKLGSSMHSIKTFWSPELKKERALRKEESAKYSLINDQLKLFNSENQKQALLVRQLEEELRLAKVKGPSMEIQSHMDSLVTENEHLMREANILRETIKELELRIETQKQTLSARDESIKKLLEMLQQKGKDEEKVMVQQVQTVFQKQVEEARQEIQKRDQDILTMTAKMKTLEEQHQDYTRHIMVLKESLVAKEEHYNMLQADVEELRHRLEEKNKTIEKKTQQALQATQERNKVNNETTELKDHLDIKERKISVLQRKLDLHSATEQLQTDGKAAMELQEQMRMLEERGIELESRAEQLANKEKTLVELESRLETKKNQLDNLEMELSKAASSNGMAASEANQQLTEMRKALGKQEEQITLLQREKKAAEDALNHSQTETERLLQVMQLGQEEQFSKDKTIMELQEALRAERAAKRGSIASSTSVPSQPLPSGPAAPGPSSAQAAPTGDPSQKPPTQSVLDGFTAPLSGTTAGNLAASAAEKATASAQAAKATLEQAKNAAQNKGKINSGLNGTSPSHYHKHEKSEISKLEEEGKERELQLYVRQLEVDIKLKDPLIEKLTAEAKRNAGKIAELEEEIISLENDLHKSGKIDELEELIIIVKQKNERIEALENALKQSVAFATDLEMQRQDEDDRRKEISEKLEQLENRLEIAKNSPSMKCTNCKSLREKLSETCRSKKEILQERKKHLDELFDLKHEALTAALSEKDAHIALLELNFSNTSENKKEHLLSLVQQRAFLTEKINRQSEERIRLMQKLKLNPNSL